MLPEPKYLPGQEVTVRGSVDARVDRVMFCMNCVRPIYKVEWWHDGQPHTWEVEEIDIQEK